MSLHGEDYGKIIEDSIPVVQEVVDKDNKKAGFWGKLGGLIVTIFTLGKK